MRLWRHFQGAGVFCELGNTAGCGCSEHGARLAQLVERKALNLVVVGSSPTVGVVLCFSLLFQSRYSSFFQRESIAARSPCLRCQCSLAVEHPLSKREVVGSNPAIGFFSSAEPC